ncbi:unnamed protein product, partial [Discosporangium mesarthrocarpum]
MLEEGKNSREEEIDHVPSICEVLSSLGDGLPTEDAASQGLDEAHIVGVAMSRARALTKDYREHLSKLRVSLERAQRAAAEATREGRELASSHLANFDRLHAVCSELRRNLEASGDAQDTPEGNINYGGGKKEDPGASFEAASALAVRYRSLLGRRARLRSALRVLELSEEAKAALGKVTPGAGSGIDEAMKHLRLLKSLRDELDGAGGRAKWAGQTGEEGRAGGAQTTFPAPELAKVADGRLAWLTENLRARLLVEVVEAWAAVDPLSEGGSKVAGSIDSGNSRGSS